ncbi:SDR family oxidoreductase [Streptomyces gardneri]|nr:SDR family oxidoreductase [Streptomyces gardneri]
MKSSWTGTVVLPFSRWWGREPHTGTDTSGDRNSSVGPPRKTSGAATDESWRRDVSQSVRTRSTSPTKANTTVNVTNKPGALDGTTSIVTGASRGFGLGIARALSAAGAHVVGVARGGPHLDAVRDELGATFTAVSADAADPATAARLLDEHRPRTVVLCAGATPRMSPLQDQTWETFSQNWSVDVAQAFYWIREALRRPLAPGSSVIAISSGAAIHGSPLSGGYAGAKATVKFITSYAAVESERAELGIRFVSVLPQLTPATDLGAAAVAGYAERQGVDVDTFVRALGPSLTPEQVGKSVLEIATAEHPIHPANTLTAAGMSPLA